MLDKKRFPKLAKMGNAWFLYEHKDGGKRLLKIRDGEITEKITRQLKFGTGKEGDLFFDIRIVDDKLVANYDSENILYSCLLTIEDDDKNILVPDILTKEKLEKFITKDTTWFYYSDIQEIFDGDLTLTEYFKTHNRYTFEFKD